MFTLLKGVPCPVLGSRFGKQNGDGLAPCVGGEKFGLKTPELVGNPCFYPWVLLRDCTERVPQVCSHTQQFCCFLPTKFAAPSQFWSGWPNSWGFCCLFFCPDPFPAPPVKPRCLRGHLRCHLVLLRTRGAPVPPPRGSSVPSVCPCSAFKSQQSQKSRLGAVGQGPAPRSQLVLPDWAL